MKNIAKIISESVATGGKNFVRAAVHQVLGEDIQAGQTVACVDDPISGIASGTRCKVNKLCDNNPGFAECTIDGGNTVVRLQTSLLVPI